MIWTEENSYIVGNFKKHKFGKNPIKVASFDLDDTIIKPTGNKKFSTGSDDWTFCDNVVAKLKKLHKDGYSLVILTNQKGISGGKTDKEIWKTKVENVCAMINLPILILVSCSNDMYRKPITCLWNKYVNCQLDKKSSFFCGDAGGITSKRKYGDTVITKDFSDTDYKFALNLGIRFIHRDEFVFDIDIDKKLLTLDYADLNSINKGKYDFTPKNKNDQEMIINVGMPGCGKSSYTKKYVLPHDYIHINQDTLKTAAKCLKVCETELKAGKSVVIDNTNPSAEVRKKYIDIAKKYNVRCRCLLFIVSKDVAIHNNYYRHVKSDGKIDIVPDIVYNIFNKKYEKPELKEGFYQIDELNFILDDVVDDEYFKYYY